MWLFALIKKQFMYVYESLSDNFSSPPTFMAEMRVNNVNTYCQFWLFIYFKFGRTKSSVFQVMSLWLYLKAFRTCEKCCGISPNFILRIDTILFISQNLSNGSHYSVFSIKSILVYKEIKFCVRFLH